jgi:hypothetical protein
MGDNIKIDLREIRMEVVDCIFWLRIEAVGVVLWTQQWTDSIKGGSFFTNWTYCYFLKDCLLYVFIIGSKKMLML